MKPVILLFIIGCCFVHTNAQVKLQVATGTMITSSDGANIVLNDVDLENDGVINQAAGEGSFTFTGVTESLLSGRGIMQFHRLIISKSPTAFVLLKTNIGISGGLQFAGGKFNLSNYIVNLGTTGLLEDESETSHLFSTGNGYIEAMSNVNNNGSMNPGNLGVVISTTANMGNTIIRRGHVSQLNHSTGSESILRYYDIIPSNNSNLNATVQVRYFDVENNDIDEDDFTILKSAGNGWKELGADAKSSSGNYLEKRGITDFSRITISTPSPAIKQSFAFWPNPVLNMMTISAHSVTSGIMKIQVYNSDGALVQVQNAGLGAGYNQVKMNMQKLPQGNYTIQTNWDGNLRISKFAKM